MGGSDAITAFHKEPASTRPKYIAAEIGTKRGNAIATAMAYGLDASQTLTLLNLGGYDDLQEDMNEARLAGVPDETMLYWWSIKDSFTADKNAAGNSISGSKKRKCWQR